MGKRVLISFLGAAVEKGRKYSTANYTFADGTVIQSTFIAKALKEYNHIDRLILIGTAHSMWEEVYKSLGTGPMQEDDRWWEVLYEACESSNHEHSFLLPEHIEAIEQRMGGDSKAIVIKYGLNDDEIGYNTRQILGIEKILNEDDEIYLDITHSFRSLPIYLMNCLIYINNVSSKNIKVKSISYGMLDVSSEFGEKSDRKTWKTPVVELKKLMDVQDWITGAYNFMEFGNTYKMAKLLENDTTGDYKDAAKALRKFADLKNLNYLREFMHGFKSIGQLANSHCLPDIGEILIPDIIDKFAKRFPTSISQTAYQYRMAEWHEKHHNYGYALINLVESALTFCCNLISYETRKQIRRALNYVKEDRGVLEVERLRNSLNIKMSSLGINFNEYNRQYDIINGNRNMVAHDLDRNKSYADIIKELKEGLLYFKTYLGR